MYLSIPELKKACRVTVIIATALTIGGCASKPTPPPQPSASEQLSKIVEVIDLIEQSREDHRATDNASEKMKAMITELGSEIDNIEDPANQKVAIASLLQSMDRESGADTNLLSEIFRVMTR